MSMLFCFHIVSFYLTDNVAFLYKSCFAETVSMYFFLKSVLGFTAGHSISTLPSIPLIKGLGVGKILWGNTTRSNYPQGHSISYDVRSAIKSKERRKKGGHSLFTMFAFRSNHYTEAEALIPGKGLDITCWWEVENKIIFACVCANFCFCFSKLPNFNLWVIFDLIFPHLSIWEGGMIEWVAGSLASSKVNPPKTFLVPNMDFSYKTVFTWNHKFSGFCPSDCPLILLVW